MSVTTQTSREHLVAVGLSGWRMVDASGRARGHILVEATPGGDRYHARRYNVTARTFIELGVFWRLEDATACLRWS